MLLYTVLRKIILINLYGIIFITFIIFFGYVSCSPYTYCYASTSLKPWTIFVTPSMLPEPFLLNPSARPSTGDQWRSNRTWWLTTTTSHRRFCYPPTGTWRQCCGSGSGIWEPFWPLDPGSGMGRKSASGSGIRDEQPGSYVLELRNHFFGFLGVKILKFFDEDPGSGMETVRIRDLGWKKVGSGINIPDPQHCMADWILLHK